MIDGDGVWMFAWLSSQTILLGNIAELVTASAAVIALVFALFQVKSTRVSQREATAKQVWMNYELLAFGHLKFANPEISKIDCENQTLDGDHERFLQYEWFVSIMLLACEEVLRLRGGPYWERSVDRNLEWHWDYLDSAVFTPHETDYDPSLRRRIERLRALKQRQPHDPIRRAA